MRKAKRQHRSPYPGFNPAKFYLLEDSGLRSTPLEAIPREFNVYPQVHDMAPLVSSDALLTVQVVKPEEVADGELVIYRAAGFNRPAWHMGFAKVRTKTVALTMLHPYGRHEFDRLQPVIGAKPRPREDELMLRVMQIHTLSCRFKEDRFRGNTSLLLLASGIDPAGKKAKGGKRHA